MIFYTPFALTDSDERNAAQRETGIDLNLVYRTELLRNRRGKLGHERIEIGYHIFIALKNLLYAVSKSDKHVVE
jgi:hypothetical protein